MTYRFLGETKNPPFGMGAVDGAVGYRLYSGYDSYGHPAFLTYWQRMKIAWRCLKFWLL